MKRITMEFNEWCVQCRSKDKTETVCKECISETMRKYVDDGSEAINVEMPVSYSYGGSMGELTINRVMSE